MRVLIISHMYPNKVKPLSGIFVQKQAEALARQGVALSVIAPVAYAPVFLARSRKWGGYRQLARQEEQAGFTVWHPRVLELPRNLLFEQAPFFYLAAIEPPARAEAARGIDLIHAHVAHPDGAVAVKLGQRLGVPVVVTIHGQDFAYTLQRSKACAHSVRQTLRQADAVILVSDKLRSQYGLAGWGGDLSKYRVIYNGVNLADVYPAATPAGPAPLAPDSGAAPAAGPKERVILSVGFLRPPKGHAVVLQALAKLVQEFPGLKYRIVGEGSERATLEQLTRTLGLTAHVQFLGSMPHAAAMREMSRCEIFVLPSWNEAFGVVYLEAMAHAKPVIGTEGEGIAEILTRSDVGVAVPPRDPAAVAAALRRLLQDPAAAQAKGRRGYELVQGQFTWDCNAARTLEIYREVLDNRKGAQRGTSFGS